MGVVLRGEDESYKPEVGEYPIHERYETMKAGGCREGVDEANDDGGNIREDGEDGLDDQLVIGGILR